MKKALITGAAGLVGSEAVRLFAEQDFKVYGIDNDMRQRFFGTSTKPLERELDGHYLNFFPMYADIRDRQAMEHVFRQHGPFDVIVHTAAQPAHDWAIKEPFTDFEVNALGTITMLEMLRLLSPEAVFIQVSTSKVYGDHVNELPLEEYPLRFDLPEDHPWFEGVDETMSIEGCLHSLFGASKAAGDLVAQEYGRYLNLKVAIFRPVCVTGPQHRGAPLHGYLAYLVKQMAEHAPYTVNGYKGKQVRDNIHAADLVRAFWEVYLDPRGSYGEVYNIGAGRLSNNSMLEAIEFCEHRFGVNPNLTFSDINRRGDHKWCIFSTAKFRSRYPHWRVEYDNERLMTELCDAQEHVVAA